MKIKQEDGTEIDVLTPQEVEAKLAEEVSKKVQEERGNWEAESGAKMKEVQDKVASLESDKEKLKEDLERLANVGQTDHPNFKILKDSLDKKDNEIKTLNESVNVIKKQREADLLSGEIKKIVGGDEEMAKTLKHHYDETLKAMPNNTTEEISARLEAAKKLAGVSTVIDPLMGGFGGNGGYFSGGSGSGSGTTDLTSNERALGQKLGLSEEDYKKYQSKIK